MGSTTPGVAMLRKLTTLFHRAFKWVFLITVLALILIFVEDKQLKILFIGALLITFLGINR